MEFERHGPLTQALHKVSYKLGLATIASHALEQNQRLVFNSDDARVAKASLAYQDLVRSMLDAKNEIDRLAEMAKRLFEDCVPPNVEVVTMHLVKEPGGEFVKFEPVPPGPYIERNER